MADEEYSEEEGYDDTLEESPEEMLDDDELSPEEEAFLKGYDDAYEDEDADEPADKEFE